MRPVRFRRCLDGDHRHARCLAALVLATGLAFGPAGTVGASSERSLESAEEEAFQQAARAVARSVVRIQAVGGVDRVGDLLTGTAATTGVVVSDDGYVVSSAFNFISKPSTILIQVEGARSFPARLVATDHLRMLTLLKIGAPGLVPLRAPAKNVRVGQWAIAVGRTYDSPEPSLSVGIVSAVNRVWGKAIQTDAKVSPVNYGGPLVDVAGDALGVIVPLSPTAKEETAGVEWYDSGIGFAIPYGDVLASAERLKKGKDLFPGLLGVNMKVGGVDELPTIDHVRFDSPAERAGIKAGDVVAQVDGHAVRRHDEVKQILGRKYAGDKVSLVVERGTARVRFETQLTDVLHPYEPGLLGILPTRETSAGQRGALVRFVFADSAAAKAGIKAGDRIEKWNGAPVRDVDQFALAVRRLRPGTEVSAVVIQGGGGTAKTLKMKLGPDIEQIPRELPVLHAPPAPPAPAPVPASAPKKDENKPKTGHFRGTLPGEPAPAYWAYVPDSYSARDRWGLVVWIPPSRDTMEATLLGRWRSLCDVRRLILLAPLPAEQTGFNPNDLVAARQVVEAFLKDYSIDRQRVVVHGFGAGGRFATVFAFENREQIRGLALASATLAGPPPESHPDYPLRFLFSHGDTDRLGERIKRIAEVLHEMKYAVSIQTTGGAPQSYPDPDSVAELARWIDSLDRI